jgi:hypothetical protein
VALVPGEGGAGDDQVREVVRQGQLVEEPVDHADAIRVLGPCQVPMENSTQRLGGLDGNDLLSAARELERQPTRAGADLDDSREVARQPPQHPRVEPLRVDEPIVELRLEPVEKLPG